MKNWKKVLVSAATLGLVLVLGGCSSSAKEKEASASVGDKNTLEIWTFFGDVEKMGKKFEEKYPEYKVNVKVFPGDQYQTKLQTALQSGKNVPDVFDLEVSYIGKFINTDYVADLSKLGGEELVENYVPYVQELGRSEDGKVRAVSDHSSPGGFFFQREVAKKYLGTDDPVEIGQMVDSWDKIIELGKKIKDDTNGEIHLIPHYGAVYDIEGSHIEPFVKGEKLNIDPGWLEAYEIQKEIFNEDVDAKLEYMSAGWGDAMNDGKVILTPMPAWATFMIDNKDDQAVGKWGVAETPNGLYFGGTYRALYERGDNKELAYKFIEYIGSEEWQNYNLKETGNTPGLVPIYEANFDTYKNVLTGNQPILAQYYNLVKEIPAVKQDKYSQDVLSIWRINAGYGITNNQNIEEVIEAFKAEVTNAYPEIEID